MVLMLIGSSFAFVFAFATLASCRYPAPSRVPLASTWTADDLYILNSYPFQAPYAGYGFGFMQNCLSNSTYFLSVYTIFTFTYGCEEIVKVWHANRNFPVSRNATLALQRDGNLVLSDGNLQIWSSNTSNKGVVALELQNANLVLVGKGGEILWQSFDYPTDSLVVEQRLKQGSKLIASASVVDVRQGPQTYVVWDLGSSTTAAYLMIDGCYLVAYDKLDARVAAKKMTSPFCIESGKYLRLHHNGDLRFWESFSRSQSLVTSTTELTSTSELIGVCGKYGIRRKGTCACLDFDPLLKLEPLDVSNPVKGCSFRGDNKISLPNADRCNASSPDEHQLLEARGYDYFPLQFMQGRANLSVAACKKSCLSTCSCAAAFVRLFGIQDSVCYHVTTLYTVSTEPLRHGYASSMFLKLKVPPGTILPARQRSGKALKIVANTAIGAFSVIILASVVIALIIARWKRRMARIAAVEDQDL